MCVAASDAEKCLMTVDFSSAHTVRRCTDPQMTLCLANERTAPNRHGFTVACTDKLLSAYVKVRDFYIKSMYGAVWISHLIGFLLL